MSTGAAGFPAVSPTVPRSTTELSRDGLTSRPWPINLAKVSAGAPRMRSLVVRRHSLRSAGEVHLSPEGVEQARQVGRTSGSFDRVVTSPKPRARETAEAMGFTVDAELELLGSLPDPLGRFLDRESPGSFDEYVRWIARVEEVRDGSEALASAWAEELNRVPEGGRLLMISHAGLIELGAVGAVPQIAAAWGRTHAPLEGVRLGREEDRWAHGETLRRGDRAPLVHGGPDPGSDHRRSPSRVDGT